MARIDHFLQEFGDPITARTLCCPDLPEQRPNCLDLVIQHQAGLPFHVPPSLNTIPVVPEFSTRLPIAYAKWPRLRTDLPWAD